MPCRGMARWQRNGDSHSCKRNLGEKPPGRVLPLRKALLGWGIFLPCSSLSRMKMRKKKKLFPTCCSHLLRSARKCKCVWAHSWTSFGRREQIPKALVIYVNHPSHPSYKAPTHTRKPTSWPSPLPSIPFPAAEKS